MKFKPTFPTVRRFPLLLRSPLPPAAPFGISGFPSPPLFSTIHPSFSIMNTPFLKLVADDLYTKLNGNFQDTTIIFPNKRASLFFNQYLWENAKGKTIWTPEYTTISELFSTLSHHIIADPIYLVVTLYETYIQHVKTDKTLDQLYPLMEMMLSDFQDIDNNMVDPDKLFVNIADLKELTDFSFLDDAQRQAIEHFFGHVITPSADTDSASILKTRFMSLWNNLIPIYNHFRETLLHPSNGIPLLYEGMLKRLVINDLNSNDTAAIHAMDSKLTSHTYAMVGFNILNKTEIALFKYLKENRDALFYWDYDETYTYKGQQTRMASKYEAGQFIMENIRQLGNAFGSSEYRQQGIFSNMQKPKKITFIQSPTNDAQARYVHTWLQTHASPTMQPKEAAIILCDENLLQPVLHSIPSSPFSTSNTTSPAAVKNTSPSDTLPVNVTMGYPLTSTPVFTLIQVLLELQIHGTTPSGAWRYKQVAAILKHPFIQQLASEQSHAILKHLTDDNIVYPNSEHFTESNELTSIFRHVSGRHLLPYLINTITLVSSLYQNADTNLLDFTSQIYKEALFTAYTSISRINHLQENHPSLSLSDETLSRLILQLLKQSTIPFHGEPVAGLQVMGLLETRNLDFRNVIMLSVNEGQIPKSDKRPSLIPYTLRAAFGMTTIEREVSLYAYYYYRLMQRADSITLLYNSSTAGGNKGEMSRFMLQTLADASDLFAPQQTISLQALTSDSLTHTPQNISVEKTPDIIQALNSHFTLDRIFSPTAINTYMKCQLQFFLQYIAELCPDQEVSDDIDNSIFGTIFHHAVQHLYSPYIKKPLTSSTLRTIIDNDALITQMVNNALAVILFHYPEHDDLGNIINYDTPTTRQLNLTGSQLINRHVIKEFIRNQLSADLLMAEQLEQQGGNLTILCQEEKYTFPFTLTTEDEHQKGIKPMRILLGGRIDRIDILTTAYASTIRILDYKTSSKPQTANTLSELFDQTKCTSNYHVLQALYYAYVISNTSDRIYAPAHPSHQMSISSLPITSALMYSSKNMSKNPSGIITFRRKTGEKTPREKVPITDFRLEYGDIFSDMLRSKLREIFALDTATDTDSTHFTQCEDDAHCNYCPFLSLCQRSPKAQK